MLGEHSAKDTACVYALTHRDGQPDSGTKRLDLTRAGPSGGNADDTKRVSGCPSAQQRRNFRVVIHTPQPRKTIL